MSTTAYSGVLGTVTSGSTNMDVTGWSGDYEVTVADTTTTADVGWESAIGTVKKFSGSFDFFYNVGKKPTGAAAGLTPGSTPSLSLVVGGSGDVFAGTALISKVSIKSAVKEAVTGTATFQSIGVWTTPS